MVIRVDTPQTPPTPIEERSDGTSRCCLCETVIPAGDALWRHPVLPGFWCDSCDTDPEVGARLDDGRVKLADRSGPNLSDRVDVVIADQTVWLTVDGGPDPAAAAVRVGRLRDRIDKALAMNRHGVVAVLAFVATDHDTPAVIAGGVICGTEVPARGLAPDPYLAKAAALLLPTRRSGHQAPTATPDGVTAAIEALAVTEDHSMVRQHGIALAAVAILFITVVAGAWLLLDGIR